MTLKEDLLQKRLEEMKKELCDELKMYVERIVKPVLKYFEKKRDYHMMSFL